MPQRTMTLTVWQNEVRRRTQSVMQGKRAQPLALLNVHVESNPEPWKALCSQAIPFATACYSQLRRGHGEVNDTAHSRLGRMVRDIDSGVGTMNDKAVEQYRELRQLIAEVDPEALPGRDEMDREYHSRNLDPTSTIA